MRIALMAPVIESVPPKMYGGTELIVSHIADGLIKQGHDVTLFASGDSRTKARLVPLTRAAVRLDGQNSWPLDYFINQLKAAEKAAEYINGGGFDVVHNHMDYIGLFMGRSVKVPFLTTFHGRLDLKSMVKYFPEYDDRFFVSISDYQRTYIPNLNWLGTVYNGIDLSAYPFKEKPEGGYLLFLSRICELKGPLEAIEVAKRSGKKLIMASKVDAADVDYFKKSIEPLIDGKDIFYLGEVSHQKKVELYQNALAYLFPIRWPEPFGLTMVESMACGTPVLAFRAGSVPEVVEDGVSGYISTSIEEMVTDVARAAGLRRKTVRKRAEVFSIKAMVENYLAMYQKAIQAASQFDKV